MDDRHHLDDPDKVCAVATCRRLFGDAAADALEVYFGGTRLYIPIQPHEEHPISQVIGHAEAIQLGAEIGGIYCYIPIGSPARTRDAVLRGKRAGLTVAAIARVVGCAERTVSGHVAELRRLGLLPAIKRGNPAP